MSHTISVSVVAVHALVASAVNANGYYRKVLGLNVVASEDGAGWLGGPRSSASCAPE